MSYTRDETRDRLFAGIERVLRNMQRQGYRVRVGDLLYTIGCMCTLHSREATIRELRELAEAERGPGGMDSQ